MEARPLLDVGQVCAGRYTINKMLGRGGYGETFLAHCNELDRKVVIKVPNETVVNNEINLRRFVREVKAMVKLRHPHIVHIYDRGEVDGRPFFVMQYLDGGTLADIILDHVRQGQELSPGHLALWLHPIAQALDFLHSKEYLHRDVKPGNILYDQKRTGYLGDFGIAKALLAEQHGETTVLTDPTRYSPGTFQYMAPEFWTLSEQTGAVDQYALGITVYQCLANSFPFDAAGQNAWQVLMQKHLNDPPPPLHEIQPSVAKPITSVVNRALAKKPQDRFSSCVEFIKTMAQTFADECERATGKKKPIRGRPRVRDKPAPPIPHEASLKCPGCDTVLLYDAKADELINCSVCSKWVDPKKKILVDRKKYEPKPQVNVDTPNSPIPTPDYQLNSSRQRRSHPNSVPSPKHLALRTAGRWILARGRWVAPRLWAIAIPRRVRAFVAGPRSQAFFKEDNFHPERRGHDEPLLADYINIVVMRIAFWIGVLYLVC